MARVYEFGGFRLSEGDRLLFHGEELVPLSPKALDTLLMLVERRGHVLTKDELLRGVWADAFVEENNLNQAISAVRKALAQRAGDEPFVETIPKRGYRFVASVREAGAEARAPRFPRPSEQADGRAALEPIGGAVPLESAVYIVRPADEMLAGALARHDSIVLLKGARQIGKTSLLARGLQGAREAGSRVVLTDFQDLSASDLASSDALFRRLAKMLAEELDLETPPREFWDPDDSANTNFGRYVRKEVLRGERPLVWGLDEVDRLFGYPFASEVFGLFRAWHNRRALDPSGPWQRLTLVMAYATEAHLFITDVNQSPFNVGTRLALDDFTIEQVAELDRRYGAPVGSVAELERFYELVGGHPYLVRQGMHTMANGLGFEVFLAKAPTLEGPYGDHLHRLTSLLARDEALVAAVRGVLEGERRAVREEDFYRLRAAGVLVGETARDARPRCGLYAKYLSASLP